MEKHHSLFRNIPLGKSQKRLSYFLLTVCFVFSYHKFSPIDKMLRSDAQTANFTMDNILDNINSLTVDVVGKIEKELDPYDLVSLVFLLYDVPDTALQRLIVFQRVSSDIGGTNLNLLQDWAQHAHTRTTWRYEFLEALAVCQLNSIIRKLGFNVETVQKHYLPSNIHANLNINAMKKAVYMLCENVTKDNFFKLRNTLKTYDIDTTEYDYCELVLLELMCKKFIVIDNHNVEQSNSKYSVEKLVKILQNFPSLTKFAQELKEIQDRLNGEPKLRNSPPSISNPELTAIIDTGNNPPTKDYDDGRLTHNDFTDLLKHFGELNFEDSILNLKSDTRKLDESTYPIKNPKRIGVCYIINQEEFHLSKEIIESDIQFTPLEKRHGSTRDKETLEKTMSKLNFEVITHNNIDHKKMLDFITQILQYRVQPDDSVFSLCILSHGVRGHVYAADSVKVKIDTIQNLLDEGFRQRKLEIPKLMILQACQVNNDQPQPKLMADSPSKHYLKKLNFLIYWATAPELEAYRDVRKGSIFIQRLCHIIEKCAKYEHLNDIFTRVNNDVANICSVMRIDQVPIFESTLRKKLYLQVPE